jgi:cell division protein FtsN
MASRKDFASKKRSPKPARKPSSAKAAPAKPAAPKLDSAPVANKKSWKLILASLIAFGLIGLLLQQLINIDPREIRETGISALIEEKASTAVITPASSPTPPPKTSKAAEPTAAKKNTHSNSAKAKNNDKAPTNRVPVSEKSTIAQQKEPYQFYKLLAEDSVETETIEAYKSTPKTAKLQNKTLLQTGSFRLQKDAERMKARLILNNFPSVTVSKTNSDKGTWFRVRTGPFITFNTLKSALIKLNKLNITPMQIPQG